MRPISIRVSKYAPGCGSVLLACPSSFNRAAACIFARHHACVVLHPILNLPYASTVLPVRGSETGDNDGTAVCAYPAGIDLATGEGVFVSPHYAGMSLVSGVDGRSSWRFVPVFVVLCLERAIRSAKVMCGKRRLSSGHPFRRSPPRSKANAIIVKQVEYTKQLTRKAVHYMHCQLVNYIFGICNHMRLSM
jgi:hypothetical protein